MHWRRKWQPTPVFLPGESQGQGSIDGLPSVGSHRVGYDWSDLAAAAAVMWTAAQKMLHDTDNFMEVMGQPLDKSIHSHSTCLLQWLKQKFPYPRTSPRPSTRPIIAIWISLARDAEIEPKNCPRRGERERNNNAIFCGAHGIVYNISRV